MYLLTLQKLLIAVALLHLTRLAKGDETDIGKKKPTFEASMKAIEEEIKKFIPEGNNKIDFLMKQATAANALNTPQITAQGLTKEQASTATGVIKEVGAGAVKLVSGIINKKWQDIVIGVIGMASGFILLAGPYGAIVSALLNVISGLIGVLAVEKKVVESQEAMLTRVIEDALLKARAEELRADADGVKKIIISLRNTISHFRESGVTQEQANELYTQVFTGLDFFGKLKYEINKFCDCSINAKLDDFKKEKSKEREKSVENSMKCLQFLNLYSDISTYRLFLILDMASLFNTNADTQKISSMLVSLLDKEQASDGELLMFLFDPINNVRQRFCISQYHSAPNKYPTIMAYTSMIKKKPVTQVTVCNDMELLGVCFKLSDSVSQFANTKMKGAWLGTWENQIKSIYIAENIKLTGYSEPDFKGTVYGPYFGATVIGKLIDSNSKDSKDKDWHSIQMESTNINALDLVRVCKNENFDQNGACFQLLENNPPTSNTKLKDISSNFENQIKSVMIPQGYQVEFFPEKGLGYGPFYGPNTIDSFCQSASVSSALVHTVLKHIDVSGLVKICKGQFFTQQCEYLEVKDHNSVKINGCDYGTDKSMIQSMVVPAGLIVRMWTDPDYKGIEMGPYIGPLSLTAVEGLNSNSRVMSLKIDYLKTKRRFVVNQKRNHH